MMTQESRRLGQHQGLALFYWDLPEKNAKP
jgi:hypothetical protein